MKKLIVTLLFLSVVRIEAAEKIKKFLSRNTSVRDSFEEKVIQNPVYGENIRRDSARIACRQEQLQIRLQKSAPELYDLKLRSRRMQLANLTRDGEKEENDASVCDTDEVQ